jgi:hypothetical protein
VTTGPDRLAIVNADGSFQNPLTELHIRTIAEEVMAEYEPPDPGGGGVPLTSYVSQIATLPDYPTSFPATTHSHSAAQISDASTAGRALLTATTAGDQKVLLSLGNVADVVQLPRDSGRVTIHATALNTFPSRASKVPAGYTGFVTFRHERFGTCTVGPADGVQGDTLKDLQP